MEVMKFNTKENIKNAYGMKPTLFYDIEGTLVEKEGRDIKIDKKVGYKRISYTLKLKEELNFNLGEQVKVDKENIIFVKLEEEKEEDNSIDREEIIKRLNLQDTEESKTAIGHLLSHDIPITEENLESFLLSKQYLEEIIHNIDYGSCIKLLDMNIDPKEDSLQKIANGLSQIKDDKGNLSLKEILSLDRRLSYKEAEGIAKDIYGRIMGRDIYDSIIALHKEKLPIDKENIERVMEIMDKLHHLKGCEEGIFIRVFKDELPLNIETLYRYKYSYNHGNLDKNITSPMYEKHTIVEEESLKGLLRQLKEMGMDQNEENIKLLREFILNDVEITIENFNEILNMKANVEELSKILDEETTARLMDKGIDPLKEDIRELVNMIKNQIHGESKSPHEILTTITDRELLILMKNGEDFKIENLRGIMDTNFQIADQLDEKVIERTIAISNIFNTLEGLNSRTIALAVKRNNHISLNNLYDSQVELNTSRVNIVVEPIDQREESLIRQEYLNAKSNIRLSLIKESIKDGIALENLPMEELNSYMDRKVNRYKEVQDLIDRMRYLKGKEESLIPKIMRKNINMSINQLSNMDSILNYGEGLGNAFNNLLKDQYSEDMKDEIQILERKIESFSSSLKEGKGSIKEEYKEVLDGFKDLNHSFNSNERNKDGNLKKVEEYLELQKQISQNDLILQIPISTEKGYENLNLIIPNIKKGIHKDDMSFHLNIDMENLGQIKFNMEVKDDQISIDFETDKDEAVLKNKYLLEEGLNRIGYALEKMEPENRN